MKTIKTVLVVLTALVVGAIAYAYSGIHDVSATSQQRSRELAVVDDVACVN